MVNMSTARDTSESVVDPLLVDVKELARLLACSVRSAWRLRSSGKLPSPVRVGRSVRWSLHTIRSWIDMGCPDRTTFEERLRAGNGGRQHER